MPREQWRTFSYDHQGEDPRIVEFFSLQDLKGSVYFGGEFTKLKHIADFEWDLLVIDEAHEGVDTTKTDVAFNQIKRPRTLHLSGTPFKALAKGTFSQEQIFNWTYEDEQTAKESWPDTGEENPYTALPQLNLLTYQLSRMITDRLAEVERASSATTVHYTLTTKGQSLAPVIESIAQWAAAWEPTGSTSSAQGRSVADSRRR
ncbi:winged helix-turn-helix transcriptional regulator [Janibacter endophyticus]|uniref:winged helix-turn-helix transcriptional regulator n=1 Tax=Janibacter endophyticus TaxID=2806261 RepID=UPI001F381305|nr:winged helix-turn-helix transcriptional regulator [Janibacter endophyticus]